MYQDLLCKPISGRLIIKEYIYLSDVAKQHFQRLFNLADYNNVHVIYVDINNEGNNCCILGYFVLTNEHFTNSKYFDILIKNSLHFGIKDKTNNFNLLKCKKIDNWVFDPSLQNEKSLKLILKYIISLVNSKYPCILWCDTFNDVCYYPININGRNKEHAQNYFTDRFLYI